MIRSFSHYLSAAGRSMKRSAIREILKNVGKPGMISFAGGLPAPETFPVSDLDNFSYSGNKQIEEGIQRLFEVIRNELNIKS